MNAPKCKLCEANHWPREGCRFGDTVSFSGCSNCAKWKLEIQELAAELAEMTEAYRLLSSKSDELAVQGLKRREYQRDLMRKRRAQ